MSAPTIARAHLPAHCQCPACHSGLIHSSDCAVHNAPAEPIGACDCGALERRALAHLTDAQALATWERMKAVRKAYVEAIIEKVPA